MDSTLSRGEVVSSPRWWDDREDLELHIDESLENGEFEMDEQVLAFYEALFLAWEAEQLDADPGDAYEDYSPEDDAAWLDELRAMSI